MSVTTVSTTGSCVHGITYSRDCTCMACDQTLREMQTDFYDGKPLAVAEQVWSRDDVRELNRKLNRIISLLEMIARVAR